MGRIIDPRVPGAHRINRGVGSVPSRNVGGNRINNEDDTITRPKQRGHRGRGMSEFKSNIYPYILKEATVVDIDTHNLTCAIYYEDGVFKEVINGVKITPSFNTIENGDMELLTPNSKVLVAESISTSNVRPIRYIVKVLPSKYYSARNIERRPGFIPGTTRLPFNPMGVMGARSVGSSFGSSLYMAKGLWLFSPDMQELVIDGVTHRSWIHTPHFHRHGGGVFHLSGGIIRPREENSTYMADGSYLDYSFLSDKSWIDFRGEIELGSFTEDSYILFDRGDYMNTSQVNFNNVFSETPMNVTAPSIFYGHGNLNGGHEFFTGHFGEFMYPEIFGGSDSFDLGNIMTTLDSASDVIEKGVCEWVILPNDSDFAKEWDYTLLTKQGSLYRVLGKNDDGRSIESYLKGGVKTLIESDNSGYSIKMKANGDIEIESGDSKVEVIDGDISITSKDANIEISNGEISIVSATGKDLTLSANKLYLGGDQVNIGNSSPKKYLVLADAPGLPIPTVSGIPLTSSTTVKAGV